MGFGVWGLGFGVWGLGFRVRSGFKAWDLGGLGSGFGVPGSAFINGSRCMIGGCIGGWGGGIRDQDMRVELGFSRGWRAVGVRVQRVMGL